MARFREYAQGQVYLLPPALDEFIGDNELVRVVDRVIGQLDLKCLMDRYKEGGCPAYHPEMMLKVLVYAYCTRVYSSRQIAKHLKRDMHYMWLSGRQQPDFRTINRFRGEYLKETMQEVFAEVVQLLLEQGHIKGEEYFIDGTKLEADANRHKIIWRKNVERYKRRINEKVQEIFKEVERINAEEDEYYGDNDLAEYGEGAEVRKEDIERTVKQIQERLNPEKKAQILKDKSLRGCAKELSKLSERLERYEEQETTLGERNSYSKTDPEATGMWMKDETCKPAYNVQAGTEQGFVTGYSVHQERNDAKTVVSHLQERENLGLPRPKRMIGDSAFGTEENYAELEDRGIEKFLKYPSFHHDEKGTYKRFAKESFVYKGEGDFFICPGNRKIVFKADEKQRRKNGMPITLRIYQSDSCVGCEFIPQCCPRSGRRSVTHSLELERHKAEAFRNLTSDDGRALRRRRGNEVESVFGDMKGNQGYRRCRLRGLRKVYIEMGLVFTSFNVRKLFQKLISLPVPAYA